MMLALLPFLLCAPTLQSGDDGQDATPRDLAAEGWTPVDGVLVQAGDEIITQSNVVRLYRSQRDRISVTTREEERQVLNDILAYLVVSKLESQAGEDEARSEDEVEDILDRFLENRRRQHETMAAYTETLEERGLTALREREGLRGELYTRTWRQAGLGGPRPTLDEYLRPGEKRELYRMDVFKLGEPDQVQLQLLVIDPSAAGGEEAALELARRCRRKLVEEGADFDLLVEEYGAGYRATGGLIKPRATHELGDPELRAFAEEAAPGTISQVLPLRDAEGTLLFHLVKLVERQAGAPPPPFQAEGVQQRIQEQSRLRREELRLERGRAELRRRAYLWNNPRMR